MSVPVTNRKWFVLLSTAFMVLAGVVATLNMPLGVYPAATNTIISADFSFEMSAEEFYQQWGVRIEDSFRGIKRVSNVEATYRHNTAAFTVHFQWGVGADEAKQNVAAISNFYQSQLPDHYPEVFIYHSEPGTETYLAIVRDGYSVDALSKQAIKNLIPLAEMIPGVDRVWVSSPRTEFLHILLNPLLLSDYQLSLKSIIASLKVLKYPLNLGKITTNNAGETNLYVYTSLSSVADIEELVLLVHKGKAIRLKDIAIVKKDYKSGDRHFAITDQDVIAVAMWPQVGANLYEVADEFVASVQNFVGDNGEVIIVNHPKIFIQEAILNVVYSIIVGILSALTLVLLTYRKLSITLLIVITIPVTLSVSLLIMFIAGIGINLLSLGAMAVVVGTVVDSTVVMVEHLRENKSISVNQAIAQIRPSIVASTTTSCIVFFPLLLTSPLIKSLLFELVVTSIILMLVSLVVATMVVPALLGLTNTCLLRDPGTGVKESSVVQGRFMFRCIRAYVDIIPKNKVGITLILLLLLVGNGVLAYYLIPQIRQEVIAPPRAQIIDVGLTFDNEGLTLFEKQQIIAPYQDQIRQLLAQDIQLIYQDIRQDNAYLSVYLKHYQSFDYSYKILQDSLKDTQSTTVDMAPWITASLEIASRADATLFVNGLNQEKTRQILASVAKFTGQLSGVERVKMVPSAAKTKVMLLQPKEQLVNFLDDGAFYHLAKAPAISLMKHAAAPQPLFMINHHDNGLMELKLSLDNQIVQQWAQASHVNNNQINQLFVLDQMPAHVLGKDVLLGDLFTFEEQTYWREFYSSNRERTYKVDIWLDGSETLQAVEQLLYQRLAMDNSTKENKDVSLTLVDQRQAVKKDVESLLLASVVATVLAFLLLLHHFARLTYALIAISVAGFGIVGALLALFIFKSTLSLNSVLGMLVLIGLAVNNAILIIDFYTIHRRQGDNNRVAIILSINNRLKTLLVTTTTTLVAMIPIDIGYGAGQDIIKPLGIAISSGLLYSTLASMLILPIFLAYEGD